ncbi:MAG: hypothetical protein QM731_08495 [Chitinophagaceae bacterium]
MEKKKFFAGILLTGLLLLSAQGKTQKIPPYIPDNGFWVIVTNIKVKKEATVQYYNDDKELIYEEKIVGRRLNLKRKKTLLCLKKVLDHALSAFHEEKHKIVDKNWVAASLK